MAKKKKLKTKKEKLELLLSSLYSRITDFELASSDESYLEECEEVRRILLQTEKKFWKGKIS